MSIEELRIKYATNPFMLNKLEGYLQRLPVFLQTVEEDHLRKMEYQKEMSIKKETFMKDFFSFYSFYYISSTETYIQKTEDWKTVPEDYIIHLVCTRIPKELMFNQYKILHAILKKIRDTPLYTVQACPYTSKMVIQQLPFKKEYSTYFLTIVGDILLNKKLNFIYYIDTSYKQFLKEISQQMYILTNKTLNDVFRHKFHDHNYEQCRILKGKCSQLKKVSIYDILVYAANLSTKYGTADQYVQQTPEIQEDVFYLRRHTPDTLIRSFVSTYLQETPDKHTTYKDVLFLWKIFLKKNSLPSVISLQNFKTTLTSFNLLCENEMCLHYSPSSQADVLKIKHFWDTYMVVDEENEYELEEMVQLYNAYEKSGISVELLREVIQLEYPHISIHQNTILNVSCTLWNKHGDLDMMEELCGHKGINEVEDMYEYYVHHPFKYHVQKEYFKRYFSKNSIF
jgi:hypothetical protein